MLGQRQAPWNIHHLSMWPDPADNERNIASTRALATAMQPWTTGRADLNFIGDEGQGRVAAAYGREKSARLEERKASGIRRTSSVTSTSVPPTNGRASSSPGTVSSTSHARAFEHETRVRCSSGQRYVGSPTTPTSCEWPARGPGDDWGVAFEEFPGNGRQFLRSRTVSAKWAGRHRSCPRMS